MIHLPPSMTKTGKALDLPIIDSVYEALVAMQTIQGQIDAILAKKAKRDRVRMIADGRVFPMYENREWWTAARREAKVEGLRWHDLRHTFATRLVASSKNLALVKEACGHASIVTTTRYAHVNTDQLREAMSTMNKLSA
jgi:integrase